MVLMNINLFKDQNKLQDGVMKGWGWWWGAEAKQGMREGVEGSY